MTPLKWTHEPPTVPGWYWRRSGAGTTSITDVFAEHGHLFDGDEEPVATMQGVEWAGPIAEPEEVE